MKNLNEVDTDDHNAKSTKFGLAFVSKRRMDHNFNTLLVGKPFRSKELCVITGSDDGTIRVYKTNSDQKSWNLEEISKLESKGGPVQCLYLHDVTKFGSCDLIVGDSKGTLTIFSNEQILNRRVLSQGCITALAVDVDHAGNLAIIAGDSEGTVTAVSPYRSLWKVRLQDTLKHLQKGIGQAISIKCILSAQLQTTHGLSVNYILVSDNCKNLYILQNGMVVYRLQVPSVVTAMTSGYFIPIMPSPFSPSQSFSSPRSLSLPNRQPQVAIGTEEGSIFVLSDFQLKPYGNVHLPVTNLVSFANDKGATDFLVCTGHFNAVMIFNEQELVYNLQTNEWVHTLSCSHEESDRHIVLGMLDNTVETYKPM